MHLGIHGQLHDEPGGVPQDEGGDEVPVDDVPQTADAPVRPETDWLHWAREDRQNGSIMVQLSVNILDFQTVLINK